MRPAHLRVKSEFRTVTSTPDHRFFTLPTGATIECSDNLAEPEYVHVMFDGTDLLAFTRDIRERTEKVKGWPPDPFSPR